jgi:hypothetical protein
MPAQASAPIPRSSRPKRPLRRRAAARPLDDGTTEVLRVIEFVWRAGESIQPVLMIERELLN